MKKIAIRNQKSPKPVQPRLFDVIIDQDKVFCQFKIGKNDYETVPWVDLETQVAAAKAAAQQQ